MNKVNVPYFDNLTQSVNTTDSGVYLRTKHGVDVVHEVLLEGADAAKLPGEIADLMQEARLAAAHGVDSLVGAKHDPVTGGIGKLQASGRDVLSDKLILNRSYLTLAAAGDSITAFGHSVVSNVTYHDIRGYLSHAMAISRGRLILGSILSMPGSNTAAIVAAMDAWLPTVTEKVVVFFAGANDFARDIAPSVLFGEIMSGVTKIKSAGKIPVVGTILPRFDEVSTSPALRLGTNALLRQAQASGQIVLIDWDYIFQSTDGTIQQGAVTYDQVHPYSVGAERMGQELVNAVEAYLPVRYSATSWAPVGAIGHRVSNGVLAGTTGNKTGGATGNVANLWDGTKNGSGTVVFSKVAADADDPDQTEWQKMVVTGSGGAAYGAIQQQIAAGAGNVSVCCEVEIVSATAHLLDYSIAVRSFAGSSPQATHLAGIEPDRFYTAGTRKRFLKTPEIAMTTAEAASAFVYIGCSAGDGGSVTMKIRRVGQRA